MQANYYVSSMLWSSISKILDALINFVSIPLLINYFGKDTYGILSLGIAINAYLSLLDFGITTGSIKHFSQWKGQGKFDLIDRIARTSISFYSIIGMANAIVLISVAIWGESLFELSYEQFKQFQIILIILSAFSLINWVSSVFSQLLIADEKISFIQQISSIRTIINLFIIILAIAAKLSLVQYFFLFLLISSLKIVPYYISCRKRNLISSFLPQFYWKDFKIVLKYSLALFAMAIFQVTAMRSRPVILGMFSDDGVGIVAEYRIIEVFPIFIISLGGILTSILLPRSSKIVAENDEKRKQQLAYQGTQYTSILTAVLCFPVMLCSRELITAYVGESYSYLAIWLTIWCFTVVLFLHSTPASSLILATGKTKMLVYSTAFACIISILVNAILCVRFGVGSSIIGYFIYIVIHMGFYYFYFYNKILNLKSFKVFRSFIIPTFLGFLAYIMLYSININFAYPIGEGGARVLVIIQCLVKGFLWLIMYAILLIGVKVVKFEEIGGLLRRR